MAREDGDELVLAGLQVADEEPLHAAFQQRVRLALRVQIVRDVLVVDLQLDGIEAEELADVHRDEHGRLRVRREEQLLFEQEQVAIQIENLLLEILHVLVERAELRSLLGAFVGSRRELGHRSDRLQRALPAR